MRLLALQLPVVAVSMVCGSTVMAIGRERQLVLVALVSMLFNIGANLAIIPVAVNLTGNGGVGAAIATVGSETVMLLGLLCVIPKRLLDPAMVWTSGRIAIAGAATAIVGMQLLPFTLAACVAGGAFTYFLTGAVLRVITLDDVRLAISLGDRLVGRQLPIPKPLRSGRHDVDSDDLVAERNATFIPTGARSSKSS